LYKTIIHINVKLKEASLSGQSALEYAKYSRGSKDYLLLAKELIYGQESSLDSVIRRIIKEKVKELTEITFSLHEPAAREVYLVGDFNYWKIDPSNRLKRVEDGQWIKRVNLKPGRYHYKFVIDGEWREDPNNLNKEENNFGGFNSLIEVQ
jgi:hypothetical protein